MAMLGQMYYYTIQEAPDEYAGTHEYSENPRKAMIFDNIILAARVAAVEGAEIRVLTRKEELAEFREESMDSEN